MLKPDLATPRHVTDTPFSCPKAFIYSKVDYILRCHTFIYLHYVKDKIRSDTTTIYSFIYLCYLPVYYNKYKLVILLNSSYNIFNFCFHKTSELSPYNIPLNLFLKVEFFLTKIYTYKICSTYFFLPSIYWSNIILGITYKGNKDILIYYKIDVKRKWYTYKQQLLR